MQDFEDSSPIASDRAALRERLRAEGYLFFRGLMDRDVIHELAAQTKATLGENGWFEPGTQELALPPRIGEAGRSPHGDPGYEGAVALDAFQGLSYNAQLRQLMRTLIGDDAFPLPSWAQRSAENPYPARASVLRTVYPQSLVSVHNGMYEHQDYRVFGVVDMFTAWIPLIPIDRTMGGLAVRPGGHANGQLTDRLLVDAGSGWATTDYEVGDVLVFHALTPHAALPNNSDRLRLSADTRFQSTRAPLVSAFAYGMRDSPEFIDAPFMRNEWWEPVPETVKVVDRELFEAEPPLSASEFVPIPGHPEI
ncbi:phytanoyl-CoA dioxygenase family protein [Streptomyces sp. NBC_00249]|uniref:phytanoyl-CoA dioxygenase family protein n=1 Tax=Streptomyces sp. NBC_00249 TaxID=2975690 RepID=UPI00225758E5|nr:phytanoyl-CoA dioxygenase family protein [Streptomyces sp. NBC_00249]MCX5195917.1 phytanoyl-CoA dioxygenase family protein [Streptomyces sp. NBC_00249]